MDRSQRCDGLHFYYELILDDEVRSSFTNVMSLVSDRQGSLPAKGHLAECELHGECFFVNCLEKTWTQVPVDFDGGADDSTSECIEVGWRLDEQILGVLGFLAVHISLYRRQG